MTTGLSETAAALKREHGDLLAGESSFRETTAQLAAVDAIEAARLRLCGNDRLASGQLVLDVTPCPRLRPSPSSPPVAASLTTTLEE